MVIETMRERLFTMRLAEDEAARLEAVARFYGMPAAALIRMLVQREAESLTRGKSVDPLATKDREKRARSVALLRAIGELGTEEAPAYLEHLIPRLRGGGYQIASGALPRMLNDLRVAGYARKVRAGFVLTDAGADVLKGEKR